MPQTFHSSNSGIPARPEAQLTGIFRTEVLADFGNVCGAVAEDRIRRPEPPDSRREHWGSLSPGRLSPPPAPTGAPCSSGGVNSPIRTLLFYGRCCDTSDSDQARRRTARSTIALSRAPNSQSSPTDPSIPP